MSCALREDIVPTSERVASDRRWSNIVAGRSATKARPSAQADRPAKRRKPLLAPAVTTVDGRPRGYIAKVGLSRINLRTLAHRGELPGITKSSW